jgi:hypothetical protein
LKAKDDRALSIGLGRLSNLIAGTLVYRAMDVALSLASPMVNRYCTAKEKLMPPTSLPGTWKLFLVGSQ